MTERDDTNRGAAWPNDKNGVSARPDFRGFINVEGKEFWASVWVKVAGPNAKNPGQKFLSFCVEPKEEETGDKLAGFGEDEAVTGNSDNGTNFSPPEFKNVPVDDDLPF